MVDSIVKDTVKFHDDLSPVLWVKTDDGYTLDPMAASLIDKTVKLFTTIMDEPLEVNNVILAGSMCGYNYTKFSDIDVHIEYDVPEGKEDEYTNIFKKTNQIITLQYGGIYFRDCPIELYATPDNSEVVSNGVYSVTEERWLKEPMKSSDTTDVAMIEKKYAHISGLIDELMTAPNVTMDTLKRVFDIIHNYRSAGIESAGELSVENLVYKALRNGGYMQKLRDLARELMVKDIK